MTPEGNDPKDRVVVAAVSGGPDSVYLLRTLSSDKRNRIIVGHVNYGSRGADSDKDQKMVEDIGKKYRYPTVILVQERESAAPGSNGEPGNRRRSAAGFEKRAREIRYRFLRDLSGKEGASAVALAHTADDQIETILMRVFEGAGIGGLKGIPRATEGGIVRPILNVWKEDILDYLKKRKIRYRIDRTNNDTRLERNWVRHVLIPLLEERYGKAVKKRIFTLGERFRELDDYLETEANRWIRRNVKLSPGRMRRENVGAIAFRRKPFSALPSVLRVKILQRICFDRLGVAPNERLLKGMDRTVSSGGPSARLDAGKGWKLANRYEEALFLHGEISRERHAPPAIVMSTPGEYEISLGRQCRIVAFSWEAGGKGTAGQARRLAAKGDAEVFDEAGLTLPLAVRPLRVGDRIRPFGSRDGGNARNEATKVKAILIDRKVPREERWGRPVVCDAEDTILWIPGVLRSSFAPVTTATRKTAILRIRSTK